MKYRDGYFELDEKDAVLIDWYPNRAFRIDEIDELRSLAETALPEAIHGDIDKFEVLWLGAQTVGYAFDCFRPAARIQE